MITAKALEAMGAVPPDTFAPKGQPPNTMKDQTERPSSGEAPGYMAVRRRWRKRIDKKREIAARNDGRASDFAFGAVDEMEKMLAEMDRLHGHGYRAK